ncbi:MAG: PAS domain S-box protein [Pseudomonadota bacterium]
MEKYFSFLVKVPDISQLYIGSYNTGLVILSVTIAIIVSYAALVVAQLAARVDNEKRRYLLLTMGGATLGIGVWAMHFIGMLGFSIPCGITYDPLITIFSMLPGVLAGIFSLHLISRQNNNIQTLLFGGIIFGGGIGMMHYSGMAAMQMDAFLRYDLKLFILSILVAVVLAVLSLWVRFGIIRLFPGVKKYALLVSAVVMGAAVSGMHYVAMEAAYFLIGDVSNVPQSGFDPTMVAIIITGVTGVIVSVVLLVVFSQFSRQIEYINKKLKDANHTLKYQKIALDYHAIVSITDVAGNITYVNDKFIETSGYSREELLGQNHRIIKSNEHSDSFYKNLWQTISKGNIWQGEINNLSKGGTLSWLRSTIVPFIDEVTGKPDQYIAIRTDITEIKKTQTALARMSTVFQDAVDPMIIEDLNGVITNMNYEAERAYGWKKEELIGLPIKILVPKNSHERTDKLFSQCLAGKEIRGIEGIHLTKDGSELQILLTLSLLRDEFGKAIGVVSYAADISERKQMESVLQEKYEVLEKFKQMAIGRELKMIDLKIEVNQCLQKLGKNSKYEIVSTREDKK